MRIRHVALCHRGQAQVEQILFVFGFGSAWLQAREYHVTAFRARNRVVLNRSAPIRHYRCQAITVLLLVSRYIDTLKG